MPGMTLEQVRQQYPEYADRSDEELAKAIHQKFYADRSYEEVASRLGVGASDKRMGRVEAAGRAATMGAGFGFTDEIAGAGRALIDKYLNRVIQPEFVDPRPFGEVYRDFRDEYRQGYDEAKETYPAMSFGAEVVPGLLGGGAAVSSIGKPLLKSLPKLAGVGAAMGGATGVGYADGDLGDRVAGGVTGAATGAALSTGIPILGAGLRRAGGNLFRRTGLAGAKPAAQAAARRDVLERLHAAGMTADDAKKALAENPNLTLADLGSDLQELTATIAKSPGRGSEALREFLEERNVAQYDRVMPELQKTLGGATRNFAEAEATIMDRAREIARPLYNEAYEVPIRITPKMGELLNRPMVKAAWKDAIKSAQDEGVGPDQLGVLVGPNKIAKATGSVVDPAKANHINMRRLDYTLRELQGRVGPLLRAGDKEEARRVQNNLHELREAIIEQNPVFGKARSVWADAASNRSALEAGEGVFSNDADALTRTLKGLSQSERDHFMVGALRAIERKLSRKTDAADVMRELRDTRHGRELMRAIAGSEANFAKFLKMAADEKRMTETYRAAMTGSPTFKHMAHASAGERGEQLGTLAGIWLGSNMGIPGLPFLMRKSGRRAAEFLQRADMMKRDETAKLLMQRDPQALLEALQARPWDVGMVSGPLGAAAARNQGLIGE